MSSMRNAIQRRAHRERAQPLERQKLGLLEKHSDYARRAKDYSKKKAQLKSLRQKAADRNEDEFFFGMLSRKGAGSSLTRGKAFTGTIEGDRGNKAMDVSTVRLLKTQDSAYLRTMRNKVAKDLKQLEERYILAGGETGATNPESEDEDEEFGSLSQRKPKKIKFMDDAEEREKVLESETQNAEISASEDEEDDDDTPREDERKAQNLKKLRLRLQNERKKLKALDDAEHELELQRARMAKTRTYGGVTKSGKKIKVRERKR